MSTDWLERMKPMTVAEMRALDLEMQEFYASRRRAARAKEDEIGAERAKAPCPYWSDGVHCYSPGFVQGGGYFDPMVQPNVVDAKQCKCGARIRPVKVTP